MAELFCDSFDWYGSLADLTAWWDVGNTSTGIAIVNGSNTPFNTGQALSMNMGASCSLTKNWGSNENAVYGSIRFYNSGSVSSGSCIYLQFSDGSNAQVTVRFNGDGSLSVTSGGPSGSVLTTLAGIIGSGQWNSFQFKIVINSTTGTVNIRKNGSTTDLYAGTGLNTQAGSSNSYVNTVTLEANFGNSNVCYIDDLFINSGSGASPNSWPGDPRALQQLPVANTQTQWTPNLTSGSQFTSTSTSAYNINANKVSFASFVPTSSGKLTGFSANLQASFTGNLQIALYDSTGTGGAPGNLIASSVVLANPSSGVVTASYSGSTVNVVAGTTYYVAALADGTCPIYGYNGTFYTLSQTYASGFPSSASAATSGSNGAYGGQYIGVVLNYGNYSMLNPANDGDTTYLQATAVGTEDKFSMSSILTSYNILGVNYLILWKKTDAGARTATLTTQANGSAETTVVSQNSLSLNYGYSKSFQALDPTSVVWTPTTVNGQIIGLKIAV